MRKLRSAALAAAASLVLAAPAVFAGTAIRLDLNGLVAHADLVLEGRVLSARVFEDAPGRIETEFTIQVSRTYWGQSLATQVIRLPGGVMPDGHGLVLPGMPTIVAGEEALLFFSKPSATGTRMPVGLAQGKFRIVRDISGARSLVRDQRDLTLVDPASGAVAQADASSRLEYADAIAQIEAAVAAKRELNRTKGR